MLSRRLVRPPSCKASAAVKSCLLSVFATFRTNNLEPVQSPSSWRFSSSSSSSRWKARQGKDRFVKEATIKGLKSRAAFKLLQINDKYRIFARGQTVVDLGFAPGSWSQVAVDLTKPNSRVIGIDILPAQPPRGASAIQGNFLSPSVQAEVQNFLLDPDRGRPRNQSIFESSDEEGSEEGLTSETETGLDRAERDYIDLERHDETLEASQTVDGESDTEKSRPDRMIDVVLSDMSAPWPTTTRHWNRTLSNPYNRLMNTSGIKFKDHAGSMELCGAASDFCVRNLRAGGHFVCKCYQGPEDKDLEMRLKTLFRRVIREKPEASRSGSKEFFFIALRRKDSAEENGEP